PDLSSTVHNIVAEPRRARCAHDRFLSSFGPALPHQRGGLFLIFAVQVRCQIADFWVANKVDQREFPTGGFNEATVHLKQMDRMPILIEESFVAVYFLHLQQVLPNSTDPFLHLRHRRATRGSGGFLVAACELNLVGRNLGDMLEFTKHWGSKSVHELR